MRNKRLLAISAIAISASVFMTACSFGGDGKTDKTETVEVTDTPTPEVTQAPTETPVPTIAPNVQSTTYTSADKSIAINLPDATWANKTDETDMLSLRITRAGKYPDSAWTGRGYDGSNGCPKYTGYGSISGTGRWRQSQRNRF